MSNTDLETPIILQRFEEFDISKLATVDSDNPIFVTALKTLHSFNENPEKVARDLTKLVDGVIEG